ncbi:MAG: hypothetical protein IJE46_06680 [Clostridia bacterium]|nr:hypothetical protein [Clostridia bacterium]
MFEDFDLGGNAGEVAQSSEINNTEVQNGTADDTENQGSGALNVAGGNLENVADSSKGTENVQSKEDNARFAAARRESEARTRQMENRMNALAKSQGFNSFDEFEKHLKEEKLNEMGKKLYDTYGVDADEVKPFINDMVNAHPDVIKAREALELSRQQEAERYVKAEIEKIQEFNPDIKSFEDILALDNFSEIEDLLNKNYSISDAYKLANLSSIVEQGSKKGAQMARNDIESKNHLTTTKGAGAGDTVIVPEDIKEQYRAFIPGITDEEIAKDFKKSMERK